MGISLEFAEGKVRSFITGSRPCGVERLKVVDGDELDYVCEAIRQTRRALNGRVPLIGFAGAPLRWRAMPSKAGDRGTISTPSR